MNPEIRKSFRADRFTAEYPVEPEHDGMRLDSFIHLYMPTLSREFLKKKIEKGEVEISGRKPPHKPSTKVHQREFVKITTHNTPELEDEEWMGKPLDLSAQPEVLYEDQGLIVCNKPAFMTTHPAGRHLFYVATTYFATIHDKVIHSIHRLDRETSGVLLLGKDTKISNQISQLFEDDKIRKCYFLISKHHDTKRPMPFKAEERLGERPGLPRGMHMWHDKLSSEGRDAETEFWHLHETPTYTIALAFPKSGRQHQIRLHAAAHGYPLVGDKMYNGDPTIFMRFKDKLATPEDHELMEIPRQALHALALRVPYPTPDKITTFRAPIPEDLRAWLSSKGIDPSMIEEKIEAALVSWSAND